MKQIKVDRAVISTEFVDKYKNNKELKQYTDPVMYFFRFNENVPILKIKCTSCTKYSV